MSYLVKPMADKQSFLLSKSSFLKGHQCLKFLYLHNKHEAFDIKRDPFDNSKMNVFKTGTEVGLIAQQLFPGGIDVSPKDKDHEASVKKTKELIEAGQEVIYEAAFIYKQVYVAVDILVRQSRGWKAYEVKSTSSVKEKHLNDVAIQYWVINGAGLDLKDIYLVHLNTSYIMGAKLDVQKLFTKASVIKKVLPLQRVLKQKVARLKRMLQKPDIPKKPIGMHCLKPYPCDFIGYCWKHLPENSVFDIAGMQRKRKFELYKKGIRSMTDISPEVKIPRKQRMQVDGVLLPRVVINSHGIRRFLSRLRYPLIFVDFETFMPAIPLIKGTHPFQSLPFQFSLHTKSGQASLVEHMEFLATAGKDPREDFIKEFLKHTHGKGSLVVYNKTFEATRLKELGRDFPNYKAALQRRIYRMVDLAEPFERGYYYKPEMQGLYSIKSVLPALVPELSYKSLRIQDGLAASYRFLELLTEKDKDIIKKTRTELLEYCKMDTLAMVRILEVLEATAAPASPKLG